jgi:uncharacterized membrane protein YdjX (TVP38/TMEM64 family)
MNRSTKIKILVAFGFVIASLLLIVFMVSGDNFIIFKSLFTHELSDEEIRDKLMEFGVRGYFTVAMLAMLQVVCTFVSAEPVQVLAGLTFGFGVGSACCIVGVMLGNSIIYLLYKTYGNKIREYFVNNLRFDIDVAARSKRMVLIIFLLYFLPSIPYGMICFFASSVGMRYRRYITVTVLGSIPSIFMGVALGHITLMSDWRITVGVFVVLCILLALMTWKRHFLFAKLNELAKNTEYSSKTIVTESKKMWVYPLYRLVALYFRMQGIKLKTKNKLCGEMESPSIVLCNHGSFIDFYYAESLMLNKLPSFIVARLYFYDKRLGYLLRKVGAFPKSMFQADLESTKNCLRVLKSGRVLAMMPEARLSTVGRFEDIQDRTYSFLKKSDVPVYTIKINGDYLADPKWGKGFRRGALVEAELDILFSQEELRSLSLEEIERKTVERLRYNEMEWLETKPELHYRSKRMAEGLENILSRCPKCNSKYTITTEGKAVFCEKCGHLTDIDDRYKFTNDFTFGSFVEWYDWQYELLKSEIFENESFALKTSVELRLPSKDGGAMTRYAGNGVCKLDRTGLKYVGTRDGNDWEISFPLEKIYRVLFGAGQNFEVYNDSEILFFVPRELRMAVDWYMASIILHDNFTNKE